VAFSTLALVIISGATSASAAPTKEESRRCIQFAHVAYPLRGPGKVSLWSSERQAYLKDCLAKNGNVPPPTRPARK
jgi:hypothetical protein